MASQQRAFLLVLLSLLVVCASTVVSAQYSSSFGKRMVHQASVAYCNASVIQNWNCAACAYIPGFKVKAVAYNAPTNTQAYIGWDPNEQAVVVAFRGTDEKSIRNWIDDLKFDHTKTQYPHCQCEVHAGFYGAHEALKPQVNAAVQAVLSEHPGSPLIITGHSLGAALAIFSAAHMVTQENLHVRDVYVFGLPRCGDAAFATWFNQNVGGQGPAYHAVHYHDIVPHLPPELFGFHHVATEVWYGEETGPGYTVCNGSGEDPSCADSVSALDFSVADHMIYLGIPITGGPNCN